MPSKASKSVPDTNRLPPLSVLRRELTDDQKNLLNVLWRHYWNNGEWSFTFDVYRTYEKEKVVEFLRPMSGDVIFEADGSTGRSKFQLSLIGVLLTSGGAEYQNLLTSLLEFLRDNYYGPKDKVEFSDQEIADALALSDEQRSVLGKLTSLDSTFRSNYQGSGRWSITLPNQIADVPRTGSLVNYREELLLRFAKRDTPVFEDDRRAYHSAFSLSSSFDLPSESSQIPPEITESIRHFRKEHPDPRKTAFVMMRFGKTKAHAEIFKSIQAKFQKHGISALRADGKSYHDHLFHNILTYIYGCGFGVAVFERIEKEEFNPNVALEVGYMMGLRKHVLLLKDKNLANLNTDLIGSLYKTFDPQSIVKSISPEVERWLRDKSLIP